MSETAMRERAVVFGVSDKKSIAGAVMKEMLDQGMDVIGVTAPRLVKIANMAWGKDLTILPCDVEGKDDDIIAVADHVRKAWGSADYLVHGIAYSDKSELQKPFIESSRANTLRSVDISAYSFTAICQHFDTLMNPGGGIVTFTFAGSQQNAPFYGVMGGAKAILEANMRYLAAHFAKRDINVNALSAGPIKTMSASAIGEFDLSLHMGRLRAANRKNVAQDALARDTIRILRMETMFGSVVNLDNGVKDLVGMGSTEDEMEMVKAYLAQMKVDFPS